MTTLGTLEQTEDIRDGTSCLSKSPTPGPAGRNSISSLHRRGLAAANSINSIRQTQREVRLHMEAIEDPFKYSDRNSISDSQFWKFFGSSIGTLQSEFSTRWKQMMSDVQALREQLRALGGEERSRCPATYSAFPGAKELQQEFDKLLRQAENSGQLDPSQLGALRAASDRALSSLSDAVESDSSVDNMTALLSQLTVAIQLGLGEDSPAMQDAFTTLRTSTTTLTRAAEKKFRDNPTPSNLREYCQIAVINIQVGGDGLSEMPEALPRLRTDKFYVVTSGDSLPAVSKLFYGTESYWDFIYFANRKEVGENPERLIPGLRLQIP